VGALWSELHRDIRMITKQATVYAVGSLLALSLYTRIAESKPA